MNTQQHVKVEMKINGRGDVAFNTVYGWVGKATMTIDAVSLEDAVTGASKWLKDMEPAPFENLIENEEYVDIAEDAIDQMVDTLSSMEELKVTTEFKLCDPIRLSVKLTPSYSVTFGDDEKD